MSASVGDDIESMCGKCGDVWHVVVAKVGSKVAKVQCKQCGGYHKLRGVGPASAPAPKTRQRRVNEAKHPLSPAVTANANKPPRAYKASELFAVGDRLIHPSFGQGVVEAIPAPGKIDVFFPSGRRVLAQAKPQSQLGAAPRRTFD